VRRVRSRLLWPVLLAACEVVRPTPPDVGPDAPQPDAPVLPDAGACRAFAGVYVGTTSCPGIAIGAFAACVGQDGCAGSLHLAEAGSVARFELTGERGTFGDGALPAEVACSRIEHDGETLRLECVDRSAIGCSVTLVRRAFEAEGVCCLDDGACAAGAACTLVPIGGGLPETTACVPRREMPRAVGAPCTRTEPGQDDCEAGAFCTPLGGAEGALRCRALCRDGAGCAPTEVCASAGTAPRMGTCVAACDPFDPSACGAGLGCAPVASLEAPSPRAVCLDAGTGALGDPCEASGCAPGLLCARDELLVLRCAPPCDPDHPCLTGTCAPLGEGTGLGACR